jgi:serine/threonine protein phosphatase PrpC
MNLAQLARKLGQVRLGGPVRVSVSDVNEILGEPRGNVLQNISSWVSSARRAPSGHMLDLEFVARTDVGRVRDHNEDYLGYASPATPAQVRTHGWMFVLADGVGGHEKGEVASKTAVESIVAGFHNAKDGESHSAVLQRLVQQANTSVFEAAVTGGRSSAGMATTVVACALRYDRVSVAHVGDSRCYLIRNGKAAQITRDHTVASEQVRMGLVTAQEAAEGETNHILSRSLGTELIANVETNDHQVFAGDVLLLCSDGLHGSMDASEMAAICGHGQDLQLAAEKLVALANERGGGDNISVQLIRIRGVERMGMYRGRPYKLY